MKIVRTDAEIFLPTLDDRLRNEGHELVVLPDGTSEEAICAAVADADILLMCYAPIKRKIIEAAPRLRGIVKYGVGIDAIDLEAARARGVTVVNVPEYAERTVAEGAFLLMLALRRKLQPLMTTMNATGWTWPEERWLGNDIAGMTLGIVGFGRIGQAMAQMAGAGFGARVMAYDPHKPQQVFDTAGVTRAKHLDDLLEDADAVSLHTVLNDSTRNMIGAAELARMKPGALLINVSRGELVKEPSLLKALDSGHLGGAGLDVYIKEPLSRDHPLFDRPNVILLPHLTFWTSEAMKRLEDDTYARIDELIKGHPVTVRSTDPRLRDQPGALYPNRPLPK